MFTAIRRSRFRVKKLNSTSAFPPCHSISVNKNGGCKTRRVTVTFSTLFSSLWTGTGLVQGRRSLNTCGWKYWIRQTEASNKDNKINKRWTLKSLYQLKNRKDIIADINNKRLLKYFHHKKIDLGASMAWMHTYHQQQDKNNAVSISALTRPDTRQVCL